MILPRVRRPSTVISVALCAASLAVSGCGDSGPRTPGEKPAGPSDEAQVRAVAKAIVQAYADEDYRRLCAQFAPGTFTELLAATRLQSCEKLFSSAPTFEAPSPQQVDDAEVRVRGDRARIVFGEKGVEPYQLRKIRGRWLIVNEAEAETPSRGKRPPRRA